MSFGGRSWRAASLAGALACGLSLAGAVARAEDQAHEIAEKFASDSAAKRSHEEFVKTEEARKKEAERQAQEALREAARKRAEALLKADREKLKGAAKAVQPQPRPQPVADPRSDEDDILARARAEDEARKAAERARAEEEGRRRIEAILAEPEGPTPAEIAAQAAELRAREIALARRAWLASRQRIADAARQDAEAKAVAEAAEARSREIAQARRTWSVAQARIREVARREAEDAKARAIAAAQTRAGEIAQARRTWRQAHTRMVEAANKAAEAKAIAEASEARAREIARARQAWADARKRLEQEAEAKARVLAGRPQATASLPMPAPERGEPLASGARALEMRVAVLLIMAPGNKGIRRHNKTADPVLCVNDGCYLSSGPDLPARLLPARRVLGFAGVFGERAAACRNHLGCVFRGIAVSEVPLIVQPIDMRVVKHDRRRMQAIEADSACSAEGGRLVCTRGIYAEDYAMWVVPESLARAVGPEGLERALAQGLSGPRSAGLEGRF
ncbi:MAG: hypothetical protein NW223_06370 [Hyphomicrobiaceae bacterium]|nr:hypothetical protein [Hyphomicrobiaceae bacterium]